MESLPAHAGDPARADGRGQGESALDLAARERRIRLLRRAYLDHGTEHSPHEVARALLLRLLQE